MKLFNLFVLTIISITAVFAAEDYEVTYYGCPGECSTQRHASCGVKTYPLDSGGTKYFCAISTKLSHYEKYCSKHVVLMLTDGSKRMLNVKVADTCGNCDRYHIDLSSYSFGDILEMDKGEAEIVFGIYDDDGSKMLGPIYRHLPSSKFGLSEDAFKAAFDANAKRMVKGHENKSDFNASETGAVTTTTTTTIVFTTISGVATPTLLNNGTIVDTPNNSTTKSVPKKPEEKKPEDKKTTTVPQVVKEEEDDGETPTVGIITALGGGILGAAGIGLLIMKKRSPGTYEDMKQKFPEAFNQVKRGLTRRATSLKRSVTRRPAPAPVSTEV
ncbi:hypothetical protein BCR32DRAFT_272109 [Anaeromyces robustus]|jgi:hypothetical protein|uniref:RlpA-like protein double-psi beta-barrel domain-containing protein n=1 Tax=Anaeromyces robustus TaxID=1754192 RepID=A0A1Y1WPA0_9FUNG|nr:hypothetical protein BCR32DRAFT_272109 [Anaeromyces robustus]|eukprot:ORX75118.1 hypothetical protein BCR32DRAFT_272109 [Anaeromyces robustus]